MPTSSDWGAVFLAGLVGLFFGASVSQHYNVALAVFGVGFAIWLLWGVGAVTWPGRFAALVVFAVGFLVFAKSWLLAFA